MTPGKLAVICFSLTAVAGCDFARNVVETPVVMAKHLVSGQEIKRERKQKEKEFAAQKRKHQIQKQYWLDSIQDVTEQNHRLEQQYKILNRRNEALKVENRQLAEGSAAFSELVKGLERNPCFHVSRRGRYDILVQLKPGEQCIF